MTTHQMELQETPFAMIKNGTKTVECRLYDEKRQAIMLGDRIVFSRMDDPVQTLEVQVKGLLRYETFEEMFKGYDPQRFGGENTADLTESMLRYYSLDQQRAYGVLGIAITLV